MPDVVRDENETEMDYFGDVLPKKTKAGYHVIVYLVTEEIKEPHH